MHIALKKGSKIYLNGAVIRVDRKVNIELLNEATFLLESNMMDADEANTPLKQIYYVLQSAMLRPNSASSVNRLLRVMTDALEHTATPERSGSMDDVTRMCADGRYYDALKRLRTIMNDQSVKGAPSIAKRTIGVSK